ncbi:GvpL/GvpF family gas vesicle protein [Streptomyces dysideae]|uniref:Gas vesicle protein n=1 Tax=Streptomyces dysideae TaxID=909626 RepID=A0A101V028_9ACTN|nr:GvpL/GvpF family gas vesicle protein [Streptomyces dysideae]KUO19993.1 gas vesicle protein [Streptomyces dysideae]
MSTYVYGITASSHPKPPKDMTGVGDPPRPLRILEEGELAALVSDAPEGLRPKRRDLLAHQNVLAETGAAGCVLPMRFGSVAPDDTTVTGVLAEHADHYKERLLALDGKTEYNVKAIHQEEAVLHRVMSENPEIRALTEANRAADGGSHEQRLRLGEMVVAAVKAREAEDAVEVRRALEPNAAAVSVGPDSTGWLANVSFLVDRDTADVFLAAAEEVRKGHPHLELRLHGPLPPYSFVEPGAAEPAGTTGAFGTVVEMGAPPSERS